MSRQRIVATAPIGEPATSILEQVAPLETSADSSEQAILDLVEGTIGLVSRGDGRATKRIIDACESLRVIGRPGAGYDTVDIGAATARKIPVVYAPVGGFAVAEGALALLLTIVKKLPECDRVVKGNAWNRRYEMTIGDMAGRVLGIVGLGRIGAHLAGLVQPFGMRVLGCDPLADPDRMRHLGVEVVELGHLLSQSDYVSLHMPLDDETAGLMDRRMIDRMKRGAILINTARGGLVESLDVLADALESGRLSAVGLDVFPTEPPDASHRIFSNPHCIFAPHLVGVSEASMERIYRSMATDMVAVLRGGRPEFCVNPEVFT